MNNIRKKLHIFLTILISFVFIWGAISNSVYITNAQSENNTDNDSSGLNLKSPSCILMEADSGTVLYEKNADQQMKPASVTKIMTLLLVFEALDKGDYSLDTQVTISAHAASMGGSQCFFEAGEVQTVEDLIKCIVVASGNDAAVAMAEFTGGTEEAFVNKMNEKAKKLHMDNTNFVNACGLEAEGHLTTSRDIALMSRELTVKHPEIFQYSCIWMDSITHTTKKGSSTFDLANTNKFLKMYTGATGLKTGYTSTARYCMSATASRDGIDLIAVIMGADTKDIRNGEACNLLDYGFNTCMAYIDSKPWGEKYVNINDGIKDSVKIRCLDSFRTVLLNGENPDDVIKKIEIKKDINAPVKKDDKIGTIIYYIGDRKLGTIFIYADENINEKTFGYSVREIFGKAFLDKDY